MKPTTTPVLTSLSTWRRFVRRAWFVHAVLLSSLLFLPASASGYWGSHTWEEQSTVWDEDSMSYPMVTRNEEVWWDSVGGNFMPRSSFSGLEADADGDTLSHYDEMAAGTWDWNPDSDLDGLTDGSEVHLTFTNPTTWDSNGDGISDFDQEKLNRHDPLSGAPLYTFTPPNYNYDLRRQPANIGWDYTDFDGDGLANYLDPFPTDYYNNDFDGDQLADDPDPALSDPDNYSGFNQLNWPTSASTTPPAPGMAPLDDFDDDGVQNFYDPLYDDDSDGLADWDNDGLLNAADPIPHSAVNHSPVNGDDWGGNANDDPDNDLITNFNDLLPFDFWNGTGSQDSDGDGIQNSLDPLPNDGTNPSPANGTPWHDAALFDADQDGTNNFNDSYPYDPYNGNNDIDNDGLENTSDPVIDNAKNPSPINGSDWPYLTATADDDSDGTPNWSDYTPDYVPPPPPPPADNDGDGIYSDTDPNDSDYQNYSWSNFTPWPGHSAVEDNDGDGTRNYDDSSPNPPEPPPPPPDTDNDGLVDADDPAPNDATNYSGTNASYWPGTTAVADNDSDGTRNFDDPTPLPPPDADSDGLADSIDPAQYDPNNWSSTNSLPWPGTTALNDLDSDGSANWYDASPYGPDSDNDNLPDLFDPAQNDASNYSAANTTTWYTAALQDDDNDNIKNWYDPHPFNANHNDLDNDTIDNTIDPVPDNPLNHSPTNGENWGAFALHNNDGDSTLNWYDAYPNNEDRNTDGDQDGLTLFQETQYGTLDNNVDCDADGLTDYEELITYNTDPRQKFSLSRLRGSGDLYPDYQLVDLSDTDAGTGDGIPDRIELLYGLDPTNPADALGDRDGNGVNNLAQYNAGIALDADLSHFDQDLDGMTDIFEDYFAFDKNNPADATADADHDRVLNVEEASLHLHPHFADSTSRGSDGDWLVLLEAIVPTALQIIPGSTADPQADTNNNQRPDWIDHLAATWPQYSPANTTDWDGDGLPNTYEHLYGTRNYPNGLNLRNPADAHHDSEYNGGDSLDNLTEYHLQTHPFIPDTDSNGTSDGDEDSDGDGLTNAQEANLFGTKAWLKDSDGDGVDDAQELADHTDPNNASSNLSALIGLRVFTPLAQ